MRVLCVRVQPDTVAEVAKEQLRRQFGPDLTFEYVNPQTPEELDTMSQQPGVAAVYLQERPLPTILVAKGDVPCTLLSPDGNLVRLDGVEVITSPLT